MRIEMNDDDKSGAGIFRERSEEALQGVHAARGCTNCDDDRLGLVSAFCRLRLMLSLVPFVHGTPIAPAHAGYPKNRNARQQVPVYPAEPVEACSRTM